MFELFVVIILVLVIRMIVFKAKSFYKMKKKHRELMKLFEPEKVPFKVKRGLKRFFRKSKFKPNIVSKEALGFDNYPKIKSSIKVVPTSFVLLPIVLMWNEMLLFLVFLFGAVQMFDWTNNIRSLSPCSRPFVRNDNGYWFCAMIDEVTANISIIESRDDGVSWGSNHPDYNDNVTYDIVAGGDLDNTGNYVEVSIAISDDNVLHLFAIPNNGITTKAYIHITSSNDIATTNWTGYDSGTGDNGMWMAWGATGYPESGSLATYGNDVYLIYLQRDTITSSNTEIVFTYYSASWIKKQVTINSAQDNYKVCLDIDSNGDFHAVWKNATGDDPIKYGHTHNRATTPWKHSDDITTFNTGEGAETIIAEAGLIFGRASIAINFFPGRTNDIWVSGRAANELYVVQYDKSASTWLAKAKVSDTDIVDNSQIATTNDGNIHAFWSIVFSGSIRHSKYDTSWSAPETLQS